MPLQFGADPEIFASYHDEKDYDSFLDHGMFAFAPAALEKFMGLPAVGGDDKHPVYIDTGDYRFIGDGAAFELNLKRPYTNPEEMFEVIRSSIHHLDDFITSLGFIMFPGCTVNYDYHRFFTKENLDDPRLYWASIFGCDTDYDAFDTCWNSVIRDVSTHPYRYSGGHVHTSGHPLIAEYPIPYTRLLSVFMGNFHNMHSPNGDQEKYRSKYYGRPGKYRIQNYPNGDIGVEYRTPSSGWLFYDKDTFLKFISMAELALSYLGNPDRGRKIVNEYRNSTSEAIAKADRRTSEQILRALNAI